MTHSTFTLGRALLVSGEPTRAAALAAGFPDVTLVESDLVDAATPGEAPFPYAVIMADAPLTQVLPAVLRRCSDSALVLVEGVLVEGVLVEGVLGVVPDGSELAVVDRVRLNGVTFSVLSADGSGFPVLERTTEPELDPAPSEEPRQTRAPAAAAEPSASVTPDGPAGGLPRPKSAPRGKRHPPKARPASGLRRSLPLVLTAAVVIAVIVAVVLGSLTETGYVGGALTLLLFAMAGGLALQVLRERQATRRAARLEKTLVTAIAEGQKAAQTDLRRRLDTGLDKVRGSTSTTAGRIKDQSTRLADLERQLSVVTATTLDISRRVSAGSSSEAFTDPATLAELHQVQALVNLYSLAPARGIIPPMGGWAASPDVVAVLVEDLLARAPRLVVECGSGVSTLWLALVIAQHDLPTRIVSLDHDPFYAEQTRQTLLRHQVSQVAEVRDAPLLESSLPGHPTDWYDTAAIADLSEIGLLFVDGPPDTTGPLVRLPAAPLLGDKLAARSTIVLDDVVRASEQEVVARWQVLLPDFTMERLPLQKVAARFRRG